MNEYQSYIYYICFRPINNFNKLIPKTCFGIFMFNSKHTNLRIFQFITSTSNR